MLGVLKDIVAGDVRLVAEAHKCRQANLPCGGEIQHSEPETATLRSKRDAPGRRQALRERGIQPDRRVGVENPHAVGADHAHAVTAHPLDELGLQLAAARVGLGETR